MARTDKKVGTETHAGADRSSEVLVLLGGEGWWHEHGPEAALARNVRRLRQAKHWSQEELAETLGHLGFPMHQTTVAKLEAGERPIRLNEAAVLGFIFGVSLEDMLAGSDVPTVMWTDRAGGTTPNVDEAESARLTKEAADLQQQLVMAEQRRAKLADDVDRVRAESARLLQGLGDADAGVELMRWRLEQVQARLKRVAPVDRKSR